MVESLHWTWAFPRGLPQMLQLPAQLVLEKKISKNGKNQSCLKLPEMARKLIENGGGTEIPFVRNSREIIKERNMASKERKKQ